MIAVVWHASRGRRLKRAKPPITQHDIEHKVWDRGVNVEGEHAGNTGKIRERNQRDLRGERERDVKPRARDPSL
jgi:hypothetical protein